MPPTRSATVILRGAVMSATTPWCRAVAAQPIELGLVHAQDFDLPAPGEGQRFLDARV